MEYDSAIRKKEQTTDMCCDMNELQKYAQRKKTDTRHCMLGDSIYMQYPQKAKLGRQKVDSWLLGVGGGGNNGD